MGTMADVQRLGYVGSVPGSERDSDSWYTPIVYLEAVKMVLGGRIDLDPYTSTAANERVKASICYTRENPAPPGKEWDQVETCFMNPPYSGVTVRQAVEAFLEAYREKRFKRGIVLVNNATDTRFFQALLQESNAICLTNHRISFENTDGKRISGNTRGQAFFYFDRDKGGTDRFAAVFARFGSVLECGTAIAREDM